MKAVPTTEFVLLNGVQRCIHTWKPPDDAASNTTTTSTTATATLVIVYHGFLAHGLYPTVRYAAESLMDSNSNCPANNNNSNNNNMTVVAADMRGHGQSEGLPGFIASAEQCIADGLAVAQYAVERHFGGDSPEKDNNNRNLILLGSSMGGTIALHVANQWNLSLLSSHVRLKGVVLLAPMLKLQNVSPLKEALLYSLTCVLPNAWPLIPSSAMEATKQYRDPDKCRECEQDPRIVSLGGKLRLGSAYSCLRLVQLVSAVPISKTTPVLCMVADEDVVVDSQGSLAYCAQMISGGGKCTLKRYPALHGLFCEPKPLVDTIKSDMLTWIKEQTQGKNVT
jgi:acylglycerol lipase